MEVAYPYPFTHLLNFFHHIVPVQDESAVSLVAIRSKHKNPSLSYVMMLWKLYLLHHKTTCHNINEQRSYS